jgi:hypothetical protein
MSLISKWYVGGGCFLGAILLSLPDAAFGQAGSHRLTLPFRSSRATLAANAQPTGKAPSGTPAEAPQIPQPDDDLAASNLEAQKKGLDALHSLPGAGVGSETDRLAQTLLADAQKFSQLASSFTDNCPPEIYAKLIAVSAEGLDAGEALIAKINEANGTDSHPEINVFAMIQTGWEYEAAALASTLETGTEAAAASATLAQITAQTTPAQARLLIVGAKNAWLQAIGKLTSPSQIDFDEINAEFKSSPLLMDSLLELFYTANDESKECDVRYPLIAEISQGTWKDTLMKGAAATTVADVKTGLTTLAAKDFRRDLLDVSSIAALQKSVQSAPFSDLQAKLAVSETLKSVYLAALLHNHVQPAQLSAQQVDIANRKANPPKDDDDATGDGLVEDSDAPPTALDDDATLAVRIENHVCDVTAQLWAKAKPSDLQDATPLVPLMRTIDPDDLVTYNHLSNLIGTPATVAPQ